MNAGDALGEGWLDRLRDRLPLHFSVLEEQSYVECRLLVIRVRMDPRSVFAAGVLS